MAALYGRGLARLWARVGTGQKVSRWQGASYFSALLVLFISLLSPMDAVSQDLASIHMVQHMSLMMVAAPMFVIGSPALVLAWGVPELWQGRTMPLARFAFRLPDAPLLWQPLFVWALFAATLWIWHYPVLYQTALRDPFTHDAQHLSFFVAAFLFWRVGLDGLSRRRLSPVAAVPYFFATFLHTSLLGIFLALSPRVWYREYVTRTSDWGILPLEDQQMAGFLMWMPGCLIFPVLAATIFGIWLSGQVQAQPIPRRSASSTALRG
jgi:putative membrane protein